MIAFCLPSELLYCPNCFIDALLWLRLGLWDLRPAADTLFRERCLVVRCDKILFAATEQCYKMNIPIISLNLCMKKILHKMYILYSETFRVKIAV